MEVQSSRTVFEAGSEKTTTAEEEEKRRRRPWMKAAQLLEFQMQAMVYRYIAAGVPVPHHLVVPIWNSLALSSWSNHFIRNHHPSSSSQFAELRSKRLYHMDMPDPEPTRCRRTDGKKWRCSSNVVPFEKYCERHMHRGRKRSRKLVESYEVDSSTSGVVSIKHENNDGSESTESQNVLPGTMSSSSSAQVVTIASFPGENAREDVGEAVTCPALVISESTNKSKSYNNRSRCNLEISDEEIVKQRELSTRVCVVPEVEFFPKNVRGDERLPCVRKEWRSGENGPFGRRFFPEQLSRGSEVSDLSLQPAKFSGNRKNGLVARRREWKNMIVNGGLCPSMHFSPDTVLQGHGVNRVETDNEPGRCRRTDGKKWRCSKDVLPGQKYCIKHMHRGIKRRSDETASSLSLTIANSGYCKDGDEHITSQNLKLSVPISRVSKEMSNSSCSTDTTITDTALRGEDNEGFSLSSGV